jgi:hypothetical protein
MDLRGRGEGDVARTIEIIPAALLVDVDKDGKALGIEKIGSEPIGVSDWYALILRAEFGSSRPSTNLQA